MSPVPETGAARRGAEAEPLLLQCDWRGQVLWMSRQMRCAFGSLENLVETLAAPNSPRPAPQGSASAVCFSRVYQTKEGILLSVNRVVGGGFHEVALDGLEGRFLNHYFRLERAARSLSDRARRQKRGGGRAAIRQIELERQRLGRELHTGVGQMLAAIRLQLEVVGGQLPDPPRPVEQALGRISTLAGEALDLVRGISRRLHPPEWQRLTIEDALRQLWETSGIPQRFDASLDIHPLWRDPDPQIKSLLYRGAQEALSNVIRHSRATGVRLSLEVRRFQLVLTVADNGVGFDSVRVASAPPNLAAGIGLRSIQEHAAAFNGTLTMESGPTGTKLIISVPFI